ncbi:MAG: Calx-beta domain-containing protein [Anaerolineae bacterium]
MRFKSARSYVFTILLLGLLMLLALLIFAKPAFSLPRHSPNPVSVTALASIGLNASTVTVTATDAMAAEDGPDAGEFTIARSDTAGDLTVNYSVSGTATNGTDYATLSGTATIASGTSSVTLPVTPIDDTTQEGDETVIVTLTADQNYTIGTPGSDTVTIAGDPVTIAATDPEASEWGPNVGVFTVSRVDPLGDVTVNYSVGGSAANGTDYTALAGSVTLASGSDSATIVVMPIDDGLVEGDETVIATLTADPASYSVGIPDSDTVTIADDDLPIRISQDPIGRPWLYLFDPSSGRLFQGPNTTGARVLFFSIDRESGRGRIYRGANATGEILFTVNFRTGRIWAGPNETGPLLYTLDPVPSGNTPEVRVHAGRANGPILYTIIDDDMYDGPNVTGALVLHGSRPFWGPVQFLLPLLADNLVP